MLRSLAILTATLWLSGCKSTQVTTPVVTDDGILECTLIQLNDVYEIAPLSGGKYGGMARVSYVVDSIRVQQPNTLLFMAGDFLNPSLLGTVKYEGERIAGKQMIEVMNAMDFDLVTFGNHEFDLSAADLQKRLDLSEFQWMSSNTFLKQDGEAIPFPTGKSTAAFTYTFDLEDDDGTRLPLGFFGVTLNSNPQPYVFYGEPMSYAQQAVNQLKEQGAVPIGLTHLALEQDKELARLLGDVPLIMGGHEHNNMLVEVGNTKIAKADANAKTIYIHHLQYNAKQKRLVIDSELFPIDETTPSDPEVEAIVARWNEVLNEEIKTVIDNPNQVIYEANPPLDGTDSASRGVQTNLGNIITEAMVLSFTHNVDGALVNGGSIRIDDMLVGPITSMDVFRVLPFGGGVLKVEMKGSLLIETLDYGVSKRGTGAYLQRAYIDKNAQGEWTLRDEVIAAHKVYTIAVSDFLMKGYDIPFLTPDHPGVISVYEPEPSEVAYDIRKAIIQYLQK
ncbi:bifunctional metallophosphatase/5'-nucleotidase [Altibacter sp. HG106]|uniref:bifunctional metallophosphatase/5'-nucleotidase n=1 Tax=Altibacter sp. HG106 TaxID=3023937 RepID=UPI00234FEEF8|nr:bifunctional metallophosphatase/5'-nucleotidase [Altibacter sp. HG106]MDC7996269.1 bifunctional metallophosphatase/5'-nucleotidase [Altibacter sp. HG106]